MQAETPRRLVAFTRSKISAGSSAGVSRRGLDAGVVEREVESAEGRDGAFDKRGDLLLVGHVADDA
jgi:hypothetical protein